MTGTASLNGTLNVLTGSYVPRREDHVRFMTFASRTGDFTTKNIPTFNGQTLLTPVLGSTFYDLDGKFIFVTNTGDSGAGSLRDAIERANAATGADTILFNISGSGVQTIAPNTALPTIAEAVHINGSSQPGFTSRPVIEIRGDSAGSGVSGFTIMGSGSVLQALTINRFTSSGVSITGSGATGNFLLGNYIGLDATGTAGLGNGGDGVSITAGASGNTIGGNSIGSGNVISGNSGDGIEINGALSSGNVVAGNLVGLNAAGTATIGNIGNGIFLAAGTNGNRVGTNGDGVDDANERNVVSGNAIGNSINANINLNGTALNRTDNNVVAGNYVGTTADGMTALINPGRGIRINQGSFNRIGTDGSNDAFNLNERNVVAGHAGSAIAILNATDTVVAGNFVGLSQDGTVSLGNGIEGIDIAQSPSTRIGTNADGQADAAEANVIVGSGGAGILMRGGANNTIVAGNLVGINPSGVVAMANQDVGISIEGSGNIIGGTLSVARNIISGNTGSGILITGAAAMNNVVAGNYIGTDITGLLAKPNAEGILVTNGASSNTIGGNVAGSGNTISGNTLSGVLLSSSSGTVVMGNIIGLGSDGVTILSNSQSGIEVSGGSTNTRIGTNADGADDSAERNIISGNTQNGVLISGTTTTTVTVAGNFIGTDSTGTLDRGNTLDGIAVSSSSGHLIGGSTAAARNIISGNDDDGLSIIGTSSSNTVSGNYFGVDLTGANRVGNSRNAVRLSDGATSNTVGGSSVNARNVISGGTSASFGRGVYISGSGTSQNIVSGNYIGLNAAGTSAIGSANSGVLIDAGASNNTIGGSTLASGNVISGHTLAGIAIQNTGTTANTIQNNWVGLNASGNAAVANLEAGIAFIDGSSANFALNNVVSGNNKMGIGFFKFATTSGAGNNTVRGNMVGTNPAGTVAIPNTGWGINIEDGSSNNIIGGTNRSRSQHHLW